MRCGGGVRLRIDFGEAKSNFLAAARISLQAGAHRLDGATFSAPRLILDEVLLLAARCTFHGLPARSGLVVGGVGPARSTDT
jgi:hypothetical protein